MTKRPDYKRVSELISAPATEAGAAELHEMLDEPGMPRQAKTFIMMYHEIIGGDADPEFLAPYWSEAAEIYAIDAEMDRRGVASSRDW